MELFLFQVRMSTYRGISRHVDVESLQEPGTRFTLQELIGEGTYGEVYSARDTVTGKLYFTKLAYLFIRTFIHGSAY